MFQRTLTRKGRIAAPPLQHSFERVTDFCTRCGAHRSSVWLEEWPTSCPAGPNVVGISHLLAMRHVAGAPAPQQPGSRL